MAKFYAVRKGRKTGIFKTWPECQTQIQGFSGAEYKSFATEQEAVDYVNAAVTVDTSILNDATLSMEELCQKYNGDIAAAFVDGSYDDSKKAYASSAIIIFDGEVRVSAFKGNDEKYLTMRNVAGEILAATEAIATCVAYGCSKVIIFYDYEGIEKWCTGAWSCNKEGTQAYKAFYESVKEIIDIQFVKVKGHSGVEVNEMADRAAKEALGLI